MSSLLSCIYIRRTKKKLYDFSDAHNLNFHEIDGIKRTKIWHTNCKPYTKNIDIIQGTKLQDEDGPYIWFCNATYNYLIHEGGGLGNVYGYYIKNDKC